MNRTIELMNNIKIELTDKIEKCNNQIKELPKGTIHERVLEDKTTYYRSYREGGKSKSDYIKPNEVSEWKRKTELHKSLKEEVKLLEADLKLLEVLTNPKKKMHSTFWNLIEMMERRMDV